MAILGFTFYSLFDINISQLTLDAPLDEQLTRMQQGCLISSASFRLSAQTVSLRLALFDRASFGSA